jgi:oxygen-independent coproporphyrinogen-3 oxidase
MIQDLVRYNARAPRYTSYPPANLWEHASGAASSVEEMWRASGRQEPQNLSFYFHVPYCPRRCHFCGCNAELRPTDPAQETAYFSAVDREMDLKLPWISADRPLTQIHFGGGTPNAAPFASLRHIVERLLRTFALSAGAEVAIECNPAYLSLQHIDELRAMGFNRMSLGIQDFHPQILASIGREAPAEPVRDLVSRAHSLGFFGVNLDLVYGLPGQNEANFASTVAQAIDANPDRVALFSYAHLPSLKANQRLLDKLPLPSPEQKIALFLQAKEAFEAAGYAWIGLDHFAKASDPLARALASGKLHRNFQGYSTRETTGQVYGFGNSAISQFQNGFVQNTHQASTYTARVFAGECTADRVHLMTAQETAVQAAIESLLCNRCVEASDALEKASPGGFARLCALEASGLVRVAGNKAQATEKGALVIRYLAMQIDPLMQGQGAQFSSVV